MGSLLLKIVPSEVVDQRVLEYFDPSPLEKQEDTLDYHHIQLKNFSAETVRYLLAMGDFEPLEVY